MTKLKLKTELVLERSQNAWSKLENLHLNLYLLKQLSSNRTPDERQTKSLFFTFWLNIFSKKFTVFFWVIIH